MLGLRARLKPLQPLVRCRRFCLWSPQDAPPKSSSPSRKGRASDAWRYPTLRAVADRAVQEGQELPGCPQDRVCGSNRHGANKCGQKEQSWGCSGEGEGVDPESPVADRPVMADLMSGPTPPSWSVAPCPSQVPACSTAGGRLHCGSHGL